MQVHILKQGDYLIASLQTALADVDLVKLSDMLAEQVGIFRSKGVIVDVTVADVMDSFSVRMLRGLTNVLKLRGAEIVIVGISPDVALAMVKLGLMLNNVPTALDLEEGLKYLDQRFKTKKMRGDNR